MKKKFFMAIVVAVLGLSIISPGLEAFADTLSDLQKQRDKIMNDKSSINSQINNTKEKIKAIEKEKTALDKQIESLDDSITTATAQITDLEGKIAGMQAHLEEVEGHIAVLQEKINKRNDIIRERAIAYQENGGSMSFMEMIFGAQTFAQFIERASSVSTIVKADNDILETQVKEQEDLIKISDEVRISKNELESMKNEVESYKAQLARDKEKKTAMLQDLDHEQDHMENAVLGLAEQNEILKKQEAAIVKLIEQAKQQQSGGKTPIGDGTWIVPAVGKYTSAFGSRWGTNHNGIDIANSTSVPIKASAAGVVIRSYYSSSYGNVVFLSHLVNGQVYTTVYAHMNSRAVFEGQIVAQGEKLGMMGNTGDSYGQHLHFEIYKGEWTGDHRNAVNPGNYIPLPAINDWFR